MGMGVVALHPSGDAVRVVVVRLVMQWRRPSVGGGRVVTRVHGEVVLTPVLQAHVSRSRVQVTRRVVPRMPVGGRDGGVPFFTGLLLLLLLWLWLLLLLMLLLLLVGRRGGVVAHGDVELGMILPVLLNVLPHGAAAAGLTPRGDEAVPVGCEEGGRGSASTPGQHGGGQVLLTQRHSGGGSSSGRARDGRGRSGVKRGLRKCVRLSVMRCRTKSPCMHTLSLSQSTVTSERNCLPPVKTDQPQHRFKFA